MQIMVWVGEILVSRENAILFWSVYARLARYDSKEYLKWTRAQQARRSAIGAITVNTPVKRM